MELWDREMSGYKQHLDELAPATRLALAVEAITWTLETLPEPLEDRTAHDWITEALVACRSAVETGATSAHLPAELDDAYDEIAQDAEESGVPHYLSATFATADTRGVTGGQLYGIFSWLYEGSLDREEIPEWTIEAEQANTRCNAVIAAQKRQLDAASA